jgi:hypothetical protein
MSTNIIKKNSRGLRIDDSDLRNPRPKEELFVDPRYEDLYRF